LVSVEFLADPRKQRKYKTGLGKNLSMRMWGVKRVAEAGSVTQIMLASADKL
jgi:hypothetical protein